MKAGMPRIIYPDDPLYGEWFLVMRYGYKIDITPSTPGRCQAGELLIDQAH